jgi:hypothetical protein
MNGKSCALAIVSLVGIKSMFKQLPIVIYLGVLLQLVSCLQCRRCPHYFLPALDLLKGKPQHLLDQSAKVAWRLVRQLILNARALEQL